MSPFYVEGDILGTYGFGKAIEIQRDIIEMISEITATQTTLLQFLVPPK